MTSRPPDSAKLSPIRFAVVIATLVLIWGLAFNIVGVAVRYVPPIWLVFTRCVIATLVISAWAYYRGHRLPALRDSRWLWYMGLGLIGMVIPFYLISEGQTRIDSGLSAIIVGAMPLITIVLAHFFAGERLSLNKTLGFSIGFLGIVLLFLPDSLSLGLVSDWPAQLMLLGAAFCYAVTTVLAKRAPKTPPSLGSAIMLLGASLFSGIAAFASGPPPLAVPPIGIAMIVALGVGSTGLATILYLYVVNTYGPSVMAKINYFPPVVSVAGGILLLGEPFRWKLIIAFAIIVAGLLVARTAWRQTLPLTPKG